SYCDQQYLLSFPTRRSSDLNSTAATILGDNGRGGGSIVIHEVKAAPGRNKSAEIATAIEPEVHQPMFNVYPNPFTDRLRIEFVPDRKSTRLNSSHVKISYAV